MVRTGVEKTGVSYIEVQTVVITFVGWVGLDSLHLDGGLDTVEAEDIGSEDAGGAVNSIGPVIVMGSLVVIGSVIV